MTALAMDRELSRLLAALGGFSSLDLARSASALTRAAASALAASSAIACWAILSFWPSALAAAACMMASCSANPMTDRHHLREQMQAASIEVTASGRRKVIVPERTHDDVLIAVAMLAWGAPMALRHDRRQNFGSSRPMSALGWT
jgi:hypothetical protein